MLNSEIFWAELKSQMCTLCLTSAVAARVAEVACYDATTGAEIWHRVDIRHTQSLRFSSTGESVFCRLEEGRLQHLSASTGETLDALAGLKDIIQSPDARQMLWETRARGYLIRGANDFRISPLSFALQDAAFGADALCLAEAGDAPVRCFDCRTGKERWRYQHKGISRLAYSDGIFYSVVRENGRRSLECFAADDGRNEHICSLKAWENNFCLDAGVLVSSDGEIIRIRDGKLIGCFAVPQMDYPDPVRGS